MPYDRERAVAYAHRWAFSRNPAYFNFDSLGGDCTNFISQCVHAGGAPMNYTKDVGWYYNSLSDRAAAWTGVEFLQRFLLTNQNTGPYARECTVYDLEPGDVTQLSFDGINFTHSQFVVAVVDINPRFPLNSVLVATHTYDSDNRPLSTYPYVRYKLLHIEARY